MGAVLWLIVTVLDILTWLLIASAVLSWLITFNVVNTGNRYVYMVVDFLHRVTEPILRPIRKILPSMSGIDISPIILILILMFIKRAIIVGF